MLILNLLPKVPQGIPNPPGSRVVRRSIEQAYARRHSARRRCTQQWLSKSGYGRAGLHRPRGRPDPKIDDFRSLKS